MKRIFALKVLAATAAVAAVMWAGSARAEDQFHTGRAEKQFHTLRGIPAADMSSSEMDAVKGKLLTIGYLPLLNSGGAGSLGLPGAGSLTAPTPNIINNILGGLPGGSQAAPLLPIVDQK